MPISKKADTAPAPTFTDELSTKVAEYLQATDGKRRSLAGFAAFLTSPDA